MECRTGKTLTALYAADKFNAKSVLFITKLKAIPSVKNDYIALQPSFKLEVVNFESSHKVTVKYDLVIIDEAHSLGAYPKPSKRTQEIRTICEGLPVLYLSGTPSPEATHSCITNSGYAANHRGKAIKVSINGRKSTYTHGRRE